MKTAKSKLLFIIMFSIVTLVILGYFSYHALRLRIGIWMINHKSARQEIINGVKPMFTKVPAGWIKPMKQEMNQIWKPLQLKGMNYFTFGGHNTLFSKFVERSNPHSRFYQAWFGVYVIKNEGTSFGIREGNPDIIALGNLANFDQRAWLKAMGDPTPRVEGIGYVKTDSLSIEGTKHAFFEGDILSHSDLTDSISSKLVQLLGMPPRSRWKDDVTKYHDIRLKGIYGVWYSDRYDVTFVVYGCGCSFETFSHQLFNHYDEIRHDLVVMAEGIRFAPVLSE